MIFQLPQDIAMVQERITAQFSDAPSGRKVLCLHQLAWKRVIKVLLVVGVGAVVLAIHNLPEHFVLRPCHVLSVTANTPLVAEGKPGIRLAARLETVKGALASGSTNFKSATSWAAINEPEGMIGRLMYNR
jgi:hypothetical protein